MKAVAVVPRQPGSARCLDVDPPRSRRGEAEVRTLAVGVCGTDQEILAGLYGTTAAGAERLVLGHEACGVVERAAGRLRARDLVVPMVRRPCPERCLNCRAGEQDMCLTGHYRERGIKELDQRVIEYHSRSETFFLRRRRVADDVLPMPPDARVDDALSLVLNYVDERWPPQPDGTLRTQVVRRHRPTGEGLDDVERRYRAELVPFVLRLAAEPETGRATALFDLTRFSSWARADQPARIVFGAHRRPEAITSSLMLGTSFAVRIAGA